MARKPTQSRLHERGLSVPASSPRIFDPNQGLVPDFPAVESVYAAVPIGGNRVRYSGGGTAFIIPIANIEVFTWGAYVPAGRSFVLRKYLYSLYPIYEPSSVASLQVQVQVISSSGAPARVLMENLACFEQSMPTDGDVFGAALPGDLFQIIIYRRPFLSWSDRYSSVAPYLRNTLIPAFSADFEFDSLPYDGGEPASVQGTRKIKGA